MSNLPPGYIEPDGEDGDWVECGDCGGDGGYPRCCEDSCPAIGGEENCEDPLCWRKCSICRGLGGWPAPDQEGDHL